MTAHDWWSATWIIVGAFAAGGAGRLMVDGHWALGVAILLWTWLCFAISAERHQPPRGREALMLRLTNEAISRGDYLTARALVSVVKAWSKRR